RVPRLALELRRYAEQSRQVERENSSDRRDHYPDPEEREERCGHHRRKLVTASLRSERCHEIANRATRSKVEERVIARHLRNQRPRAVARVAECSNEIRRQEERGYNRNDEKQRARHRRPRYRRIVRASRLCSSRSSARRRTRCADRFIIPCYFSSRSD